MLTTSRSQFVEKIITSDAGLAFKVVFLVYEESGKVKARAISATQIEATGPNQRPVVSTVSATQSTGVLALGGICSSKIFPKTVSFTWEGIAPFPYNSILYFMGTIARGPNA